MSEQQERFGDTHIAVVTFAEHRRLAEHREAMLSRVVDGSRMAWLSDPDRRLYRALDLRRAALWRVYNPGTIRMYGRLIRSGRTMNRPVDDTRQLGADVIVAPDGALSTVFRPSSPDSRPSVGDLIAAVDEARTRGGGR